MDIIPLFTNQVIIFFCFSMKCDYQLMAEKGMETLIQFSTTYLGEKRFSSVKTIKIRYRF